MSLIFITIDIDNRMNLKNTNTEILEKLVCSIIDYDYYEEVEITLDVIIDELLLRSELDEYR